MFPICGIATANRRRRGRCSDHPRYLREDHNTHTKPGFTDFTLIAKPTKSAFWREKTELFQWGYLDVQCVTGVRTTMRWGGPGGGEVIDQVGVGQLAGNGAGEGGWRTLDDLGGAHATHHASHIPFEQPSLSQWHTPNTISFQFMKWGMRSRFMRVMREKEKERERKRGATG